MSGCLHEHVERYGTATEPAHEARCVECDAVFLLRDYPCGDDVCVPIGTANQLIARLIECENLVRLSAAGPASLATADRARELLARVNPAPCDHYFERMAKNATTHLGPVQCVHCGLVRHDTLPSPPRTTQAAGL